MRLVVHVVDGGGDVEFPGHGWSNLFGWGNSGRDDLESENERGKRIAN